MSKASIQLAHELIIARPTDADITTHSDLSGDYEVLSCDPLTVALEYNEANVVRGGSLLRVGTDGRVELRVEIKWRSDEVLPVELNGTAVATGDKQSLAISLTQGAVCSPTSGEIQDMMDAQGTLREKAESALQRHGGFGATLRVDYFDGQLAILHCVEKQPQCATGTLIVLSRAEPDAFDAAWYKYARALRYYDAMGREKQMELGVKMDLPY